MSQDFARLGVAPARRRTALAALVLASLLAACTEAPPPRSFTEFMEDDLAREGTLVRCNADRDATGSDLECINARRAAAALAAKVEAAKQESRDAASEARLLAARQRYEVLQAAAREAELAAEEEERRAYESQWVEQPEAAIDLAASPEAAAPEAAEAPPGSSDPQAVLEPIALPASAHPSLSPVSLPASAKTIEVEPPKPQLQEIELPDHLRR